LVINREIPGKPGFSLLGILERHGIGPFFAVGLDVEPAWRVSVSYGLLLLLEYPDCWSKYTYREQLFHEFDSHL